MAGSAARRYLAIEGTDEFLSEASASAILMSLQSQALPAGEAINPELLESENHDRLGEHDGLLEPPVVNSPLVTPEMQQRQLDRLHMDGQEIEGLRDGLLEPTADNVIQFPGNKAPASTGNITEDIDTGLLTEIGNRVKHTYEIDEASRASWMQGYKKALELVDYQEQAKNYPIEGAANIKYPLLIAASLQFAARAGPAIIKPGNMVRMKVEGLEPEAPNPEDMDPALLATPEGQQQFQMAMIKASKSERASRVGRYMSWQLRRTKSWEEETDKLLHMLPLTGCEFRKLYQDAGTGRKRSILVSSENVVINMKARSVEEAPRITECFELYPYQMQSKIRSGHYRDIRDEINYDPNALDNQEPIMFLEQHCRLDLDGDGYDEPVIVTIHKESGAVARIENNYDPEDVTRGNRGDIIAITPTQIFVKYDFLPNPLGGIYGVGFGHILRDITDSINTTLNQIIDAAHLQNSSGGFISKGLRFGRSEQGEVVHVRQNRYHYVNSNGADLRTQVVPFEHKGPSAVLFEVLGMLIDAGKEIASIKDVLTGDMSGSSNLPVGTTLALIEQGLQVFSAIYLRVYRAMSREFGILFALNERSLDANEYMTVTDDPRAHPRDFESGDHDITPVADPNAVTDMQQLGRAQFLQQFLEDPTLDRKKVYKRLFTAAKIEDYEDLFAPPDVYQQQMADLQLRGMGAEVADKEASATLKKAQSVERLAEAAMHNSDADRADVETVLHAVEVGQKDRDLDIREKDAETKRVAAHAKPSNREG